MLRLLLVCLAITYCLAQATSTPLPINPTTDELELMSQELRRQELNLMANRAEELKLVLANPNSTPTARVEAATEMNAIMQKTRLELYKASFREAVRHLGIDIDHKAGHACSDMGVHREHE